MSEHAAELALYHVVGAKGDDPEHPNAFRFESELGGNPTLRDIKNYFPLLGDFHLSFKTKGKKPRLVM